MTPNEARKDENAVSVKANSVLKEKYLRKYPKVEVGDAPRMRLRRVRGGIVCKSLLPENRSTKG